MRSQYLQLCIGTRRLYTSNTAFSSNDFTKNLSATGPFIDLPHITTSSGHDKSHGINLSRGSSFCSRLSSETFLCDDFDGLTRNLRALNDSFWYQEVTSDRPNTSLHSFDLSERLNYSTIKLRRGEKWKFNDLENLVGWAGYDLQFDKTITGLTLMGNGFFIARGSGLQYQIELKHGEEVFVRASSLIVTSGEIKHEKSKIISDTSTWKTINSFIRRMVRAVLKNWTRAPRLKDNHSERQTKPARNSQHQMLMQLALRPFQRKESSFCAVRGPGIVVLESQFS